MCNYSFSNQQTLVEKLWSYKYSKSRKSLNKNNLGGTLGFRETLLGTTEGHTCASNDLLLLAEKMV